MITKVLRKKRNWSQEQLAQTSGLSLRTIQRIESGRKASIESLASIASAFEISVEELRQDIVLIDKESDTWKKIPYWVRTIFIGSNTIQFKRKDAVTLEVICVVISVAFLLGSLIHPIDDKGNGLLLCSLVSTFGAYYMSVKIRLGDKYFVW